ncbi:hypothetical protein [Desulfocucumis palustris]|uniref:hypothetical protein n=1 Tax=Desulfocucumis palustris TaxID=1898651 RepID=UPI000CE9C40D|nr:hypothetical protein [Desulfocucumis palustris]
MAGKVLRGDLSEWKGLEKVKNYKKIFALAKNLLHPHREKQERLMSRIKELRELSSIASEAGMHSMYQSLNKEANELFMEYLVLCFLDGMSFLLPHAVILWLLSIKFSTLALPVSLPWVGNQIGIIVLYPLCAVAFYAGRGYYRKRCPQIRMSST